MRALPTGWSSYINGSFTVAYFIELTAVDGTSYRWGTIDSSDISSWGAESFDGSRIKKGGLGTVHFFADIDEGGNIASVGDFSFQLLNHDDYLQDTLEPHNIIGGTVAVYMLIVDTDPTDLNDALELFHGIVDKTPCDKTMATIYCIHDESDHDTIPRKMIDGEVFPDFEIPENSQGSAVPIAIGVLDKAEAVWANSKTSEGRAGAVVTGHGDNYIEDTENGFSGLSNSVNLEFIGGPAKDQIFVRRIIRTAPAPHRFYIYDKFQTQPTDNETIYRLKHSYYDLAVSNRKIRGFATEGGSISNDDFAIWYWNNAAEKYIKINPKAMLAKNDFGDFAGMAGLSYKSQAVQRTNLFFYHPKAFDTGSFLIGNNVYTYNGAASPIGDLNNTSYKMNTIAIGKGFVGNFYLTEDHSDELSSWDNVYIYCVAKHNRTGENAKFRVQIHNESQYPGGELYNEMKEVSDECYNSLVKTVLDPPIGFPSEGANAAMHDVTDYVGDDWPTINYNRRFILSFDAGTDTTYDVWIYDVGIIFTKSVDVDESTKFYPSLHGRVYENTWNGRKSASNLIQTPPDAIESILRHDLGISGAYINMGAFDTIHSQTRQYWAFAFQEKKERKSQDIIQDLCKEGALVYYKNHEGKHTLKSLELLENPDDSITAGDILVDESSKESTYSVRFTDIDLVYNEFYVHYKKDPASGEYQGSAFIKNPDQSSYDSTYVSSGVQYSSLNNHEEDYWDLCRASYVKYGFKKTFHLYLDHVRDEKTAQSLLCFFVKWLYMERALPSFETQLQHINKELCDCLSLASPHRTGQYIIYDLKHHLNTDRIEIKMREIDTYTAPGGTEYLEDTEDEQILDTSGQPIETPLG